VWGSGRVIGTRAKDGNWNNSTQIRRKSRNFARPTKQFCP
jgi:hypothetical protein